MPTACLFNVLLLLAALIPAAAMAQVYPLSDGQATTETQWLYSSMQRLIGAGVWIGHHDDLAYGVGWRNEPGRSDVQSITGSYPSLYGWDLARCETGSDKDINSIPFKLQRQYVKQAYQHGGINAFCWHLNNPTNGKTAWDTTKNSVAGILPGRAYHQTYLTYLDNIAAYLKTLKGSEGEPIPILFRPFHELTGNWFWWGKNRCTPAQFIALWRFTITSLRQTKKLHNLVVVYSTSDFTSEADFLERYPGDAYADVLGIDVYCNNDVNAFKTGLDIELTGLQQVGLLKHKPICLAEIGFDKIPDARWWTQTLLPVIAKHNLSYLMLWRNDGTGQYFAPYPGQQSAQDFKAFSADGHTMFQTRLTGLEIYGRPILR